MSKLKLFLVFTFLLQIGTANAVSFDCSKAKSYSEKLICNNSELSELDDKLNSLYQKVKLESTDKKAFRKIVSDLWNEREKCKTESCVRQWYSNAFREYSSLNEINENIINESKNYAEWYIDGALIILPPLEGVSKNRFLMYGDDGTIAIFIASKSKGNGFCDNSVQIDGPLEYPPILINGEYYKTYKSCLYGNGFIVPKTEIGKAVLKELVMKMKPIKISFGDGDEFNYPPSNVKRMLERVEKMKQAK
ncbi:TPA: lysozyme inhibitor LprI family protein [Escherichia coli]|uniref:Uncharacterized protein conserved in bacteria, putative lipoprotein n=1 Tax=Escherichia coli TaxID=562 RepID=A0A2X7LG47_ECOLX|nr:hypothetical protein [Escherichia coli]EEW1841223.1 hypothetical protein [Escherichia coli]EEZ6065722.1 hypothetical protein [Escherichia coli]EFO2517730.1 hypothetical protein [Escherichia coli]EHA4811031.1 hypothetical protein [Escherichia coli]EHJ6792546.1 hypothetical protein [Escherichia coli]